MKHTTYIIIGVMILIALVSFIVIKGFHPSSLGTNNTSVTTNTTKTIQTVAAENFWGSLVSQIGGTHVQVLSIVSDPNADPHEYESNTENARAVAMADYIVVNGAGYDSWANKLIGAGIKSDCKILNVAKLLGKKEGDNPHFWYDPDYVNLTVKQMKEDLISMQTCNYRFQNIKIGPGRLNNNSKARK
jgi:zinc/manganese transport system substrate-binding protein